MLLWLVFRLSLAGLAGSELLSPNSLRNSFVSPQDAPEELSSQSLGPLECFQVTSPIDTQDGLAIGNRIVEQHETLSSCSMLLMQHSFGNSYGHPFVGNYTPPPCDFDNVFINVTVTSEGRQFDRLATMWLGDVEVWRTSTAEPKPDPGIIWHFLKDMSPYLSLLKKNQTLIFDMGNLINDKYTGPFNVTMKATFFQSNSKSSQQAADLIFPISAKKSSQGSSSAFIFPDSKAEATVKLPPNVDTAILTVAATGQASEEFWWSNVPESVVNYFNYSSGDKLPGLSSFREVLVLIDGQVAGLAWPFPVVFTGGIAPPLHRPMVGLQAFDLQESEIDITPWLGVLSDGKEHTISMEIFGVNDTNRDRPEFVHAGSNWVLSGKIFTWLGPHRPALSGSPEVLIGPMDYRSNVTELSASALDYTQSVSRQITVRSNSQSYYRSTPPLEWTEGYAMTNDGVIRSSGHYQQVNSTYLGHGVSECGLESRLGTQFRYPINSTYHYRTLDGQGGLSLEATLSQELDLAVTLGSPLTTGLEPFMSRLQAGVSGSVLHARRDGHGYLSQGQGGRSFGAGQSRQHYKLLALDSRNPGTDFVGSLGPTLYERLTTVINDTTINDEEMIWDKAAFTPGPRRFDSDLEAEQPSEFAPVPLNQVGGMNILIKGSNRHCGEGANDKLPSSGLIDQQAGHPPHGPYQISPHRLANGC